MIIITSVLRIIRESYDIYIKSIYKRKIHQFQNVGVHSQVRNRIFNVQTKTTIFHTRAHVGQHENTTMLIVSYLSSRQFTGYRISAKLILSSVSKYRECLHGSWHSQLDERNAIPSIPSRAPPIELYTDCSPRGGLQVFEIFFR